MTRLKFEKTGTAVYMSHLDLTRCMSRAMARAGIPVWHTQGFNPHPYMVFSSPLSLGIAGLGEYMDIRLNEPMDGAELARRMNRCLCDGVRIRKVFETERDFNDIAGAEYTLLVDGFPQDEWEAFWAAETIPAEKKTKKGTTVVDLKQEIRILFCGPEQEWLKIRLWAPCGNQKNVNPLLLVQALLGDREILYRITRERLLTETGEEF